MSVIGPVGIWRAHWEGLGDLRNGKGRKGDLVARGVVVVIPAGTLIAALVLEWSLQRAAGSMIGGFALVAGVLVAVFAQFANWRTRLDDRAQFRPESEAPARRLVDAAVAHTLVGVLSAALGVVLAVLVELGAPIALVWNALAAAAGAHLLVLLVLIVNTSFLAYTANLDESVREQDEELSKPAPPAVRSVRQG